MSTRKKSAHSAKAPYIALAGIGVAVLLGVFFYAPAVDTLSYSGATSTATVLPPSIAPLDTLAYNTRLLALAHVAATSPWYQAFLQGTTTASSTLPRPAWPAATDPYPADSRALLPFNRIVAYYGNFYSTGMGILGELPEDQVLAGLQTEVAKWQAADPSTPVVPAIEYIDVTAQGSPGKDGKYRLRMPDSQIDKALAMAKEVNGIVILDIQVGLSTLQDELPLISTYLAMPDVHLAIDPEFAMHNGAPPGTVIGSFDAADINYAISYLSGIVKANNLPPKVLIVHRFTEGMVTNAQNIAPTPQVQVVMNMDGWGFPAKKINTYNTVITADPVQFAGIKLFYKNDTKPPSTGLLSTSTIMSLMPAPIYVQYQ